MLVIGDPDFHLSYVIQWEEIVFVRICWLSCSFESFKFLSDTRHSSLIWCEGITILVDLCKLGEVDHEIAWCFFCCLSLCIIAPFGHHNFQWSWSRLVWLTHWVRVTHICVGKLTIIGSDNGLSPERCQAIIWTNAVILLIGPWGTNFSEFLIEIQTFSLKKIRLKMLSAKCCSFHLGLNVLTGCCLIVLKHHLMHALVMTFLSKWIWKILAAKFQSLSQGFVF